MTTTDILDALQSALANRNRNVDNKEAKFWIGTLRSHADMIQQEQEQNDGEKDDPD